MTQRPTLSAAEYRKMIGAPVAAPSAPAQRLRGVGDTGRPKPTERKMNKTEAALKLYLHALPDVAAVVYEGVTLKLGADLRYTPDFFVIYKAGHIEFWEAKGFWRDDARAKIKMAAQAFPWFDFIAATRAKDGWKLESF